MRLAANASVAISTANPESKLFETVERVINPFFLFPNKLNFAVSEMRLGYNNSHSPHHVWVMHSLCQLPERLSSRSRSRSLNSRCLLRGAFTLSKLVLFVIESLAQFRSRFRSLSNVNRSGSQNASKNAAAAAEKTE